MFICFQQHSPWSHYLCLDSSFDVRVREKRDVILSISLCSPVKIALDPEQIARKRFLVVFCRFWSGEQHTNIRKKIGPPERVKIWGQRKMAASIETLLTSTDICWFQQFITTSSMNISQNVNYFANCILFEEHGRNLTIINGPHLTSKQGGRHY